MTSIIKLKEKCDNYLDTRVYNYIRAKKRRKAFLEDIRKINILKNKVKIVNNLKYDYHKKFFLGDDVKKFFINLHCLKMIKHYVYLKFYHQNIQKLFYNERLLNYFESILVPIGFEPSKWLSIFIFYLV